MSRLSDAAEFYRHTFAARLDDHVRWSGSMWARAGRELTADAVLAGLDGSGPSLSGYFLNPDSTGHVAAIDFDTEDGFATALRARDLLLSRGAPSYPEASRRGAHLWVVVDRALPGRVLRQFMRAMLRDAGIDVLCPGRRLEDGLCVGCGKRMSSFEPHDNPKIEWRPLSDEVKADGYGAPLRLPTMPNPKTGLRYPVIGLDGRPLPPRLDDLMLAVDQAPAWVVEGMAMTVRPTWRAIRPGDRMPFSQRQDEDGQTASQILRDLWGMADPKPGRANKCPAHDDHNPSLSIAHDDRRAWCKNATCVLYGDNGRGLGTHQLAAAAPGAKR